MIKKNNKGYFVQSLNKPKISTKWQKPVSDFIEHIDSLRNDNIHSVYLRGSVAVGTEVPYLSDLDFYIITKQPITEFDIIRIRILSDNLNREYDFITKYDISYFTITNIYSIPERYLLKLTSFCIYGEDIKNKINNPKPGKDIHLSISKLESDFEKLNAEIAESFYHKLNTKNTCIWITKKIIRAGFELISDKELEYSRDLIFSINRFTQYYPEKKPDMDHVLNLFLNPTDDINEITRIINGIGFWLVRKYKTLSNQ